MSLILKAACFSIIGFLLGSQFFRYISEDAKSKSARLRNVSLRYWLSYALTLAAMFAVVVLGAKYGLFEKSSYGVAGTVFQFISAAIFSFIGYSLTKWKARE